MSTSLPPGTVSAPDPAPGTGGGRARLVGVLLLALGVAGAAWWIHGTRAESTGPETAFEYVRRGALEGDGGALWRLLLPAGRKDYEGFVEDMRREKPKEFAEKYRRMTGISLEDLRRLRPEEIMKREQEALAEEMWRGARVHDVDRRGDGAVLFLNMGNGGERTWYLRLIDGAWRIDNLNVALTVEGRMLARPDGGVPPEWNLPRDPARAAASPGAGGAR